MRTKKTTKTVESNPEKLYSFNLLQWALNPANRQPKTRKAVIELLAACCAWRKAVLAPHRYNLNKAEIALAVAIDKATEMGSEVR